MKRHVLWLALAVAALLAVTAYRLRRRETAPEVMPPVVVRPETAAAPPSASPFSPPPAQVAPPKPLPIVAIPDGKTIDFSSGAPIVKDNAQEKAIIEKAVKDMEAALKDVSFGPPEKKK